MSRYRGCDLIPLPIPLRSVRLRYRDSDCAVRKSPNVDRQHIQQQRNPDRTERSAVRNQEEQHRNQRGQKADHSQHRSDDKPSSQVLDMAAHLRA